jgi:hypothetical protein
MKINPSHKLGIGCTGRTNQLDIVCDNTIANDIGALRVLIGHRRLIAALLLPGIESHCSLLLAFLGELTFV